VPTLRFEPYHVVHARQKMIEKKREQNKGKPLKIEVEARSKFIVVNGMHTLHKLHTSGR
jgi:hypothetical protein